MCAGRHAFVRSARAGRVGKEDSPTARPFPRVLVAVGVALALAFQVFGAGAPAGPGPAAPEPPALLFRTDAPPAAVVAAGATPLESYASFTLARGTGLALGQLAAAGYRAALVPPGGSIHLRSGDVDARSLGRSASPWILGERGLAVGIVHVHAPMKDEWRADWARRGIEILRYVPTDAFLVRGLPDRIRDLARLPYVDGVGPFETGWKLHGALPDRGVADVRIVVLPGESPDGLVPWLASRGVPSRASSLDPGPGIIGAFGSGDFRWIRARVPAALLRPLADLPSVEFIEPARTPRILNEEAAWAIQTNATGVTRYWQNGLDGRGQVVAISDTGVDFDGNQFRHSAGQITTGDLYNVTDASRRKVVRYLNMGVLIGLVDWPGGPNPWDTNSIRDSRHVSPDCTFGHGTAVSSVLTGNDNGIGGSPNDGNALGARLYVQDIGTVVRGTPCDTDALSYLPDDYADLFGPPGLVFHDPVAPVRIHSNSWGTDDNEYDIQARAVDAFVWAHPDLVVVFAAGNGGSASRTVGAPGTAKNILTVGGAGNPDAARSGGVNDMAVQSSRGPTADGRLKPTLVTIFDGDSAMSDGNPASGAGLSDAHWDGTSYSTPSAAAAAAIVRQYFADGWYPAARPVAGNAREPSAALVRAVLIASAAQMTGSGSVRTGQDVWPNNEQGFGRIVLANALPIAAAGDAFRTQVVDERTGLLTGETAAHTFRMTGAGLAKFVLTWTDAPGTVAAGKALVNDLDLEVTAPDGTVYRGNNFGAFRQGQSLPMGTVDTTNVEEAVILRTPSVGEWTVRVIASNVPVGPQPYALVVTGDADPAYGRVLLDRPAYRAGDAIRIEVEDSDAAAVSVVVSSDFEPSGETVSLSRTGPNEVWRGSIPTAFADAAPDGVVQVRHGGIVRAEYADPSPPHTAVATARVDAEGPTIWDVSADRPSTTSVRIRWTTDEPATSGVRYGTDPSALTGTAETTERVTAHDLLVTGLQADTLYYFDAVSRDRQGVETRDAAGGAHYRVRTAAFGDVLVVLGHDSFPPDREAMWAAALDAHGWTWSTWKPKEVGLPPLALLQAHRAVAWQVGLEQYPPFNVAARELVRLYLDGGGRLLVSSHDTAWSFTDSSSQFYTATADAWVRGVLKSSLRCDPLRALQLRGATGDPISGNFTAGLSYAPHRDGGALDELVRQTTGPLASTTVWTDDQVNPNTCGRNPVGIRWVSSANNGTSGVGAWGGRPSRLVYYAFELTGLDATAADPRPTSPTRATVLDNTLRWLVGNATGSLDRDHPNVAITAPNSGTFSGPTVPIAWTATSTGTGLRDFALSYSADGGQTWSLIATLASSARSHTWDVGSLPNGDRYLLRIVARDAGVPSLLGSDESDGTISIRRTGGDLAGPRVWAGSVRIAPNPAGAGATAWVNGTADDRLSGGSPIAAAEFFVSAVEPAPSASGTGTPLDPADGTLDGPLEDLTWSEALALAPGSYCLWVHARDAAGNWGPYESACVVVVAAGPDVTPPSVARLAAARLASGGADIDLTWDRSRDDGLFGGATAYRVLRSTTAQVVGAPISGTIPADGSAQYTYRDALAGSNASDYFYRIEAFDEAGNRAVSTSFAAKVRIAVVAGPNLLGMPLDPTDGALDALAGGVAWASAWSYDGCAAAWTSALPPEAASFRLGLGRGFWLNATAPGTVVAVGVVLAAPRVDLCAGWNLVALPGFAAGVTVAAVKALTGADLVAGFDAAAPYHTRALGDGEVLAPGRGVWIRVPAPAAWTSPAA